MESNDWPANQPEWKKEHVERMQRMVECYKNHVSIIMWSTGNESGHGTNHLDMISWTRAKDSTRLIHCEDASRKDGVEKYGGDFEGELTHDGNFCCDGLVFADRSFKAGTYEAKAAYQPIKTTYSDGILTVYNRLDFTNLDEYEFRYWIEKDGVKEDEIDIMLSVSPHSSKTIVVEYTPCVCRYGVTLNTSFMKDGKEYARTQHVLESVVETKEEQDFAEYTEDDYNVYITGSDFLYVFSKHYGTFTSMIVDREEQLAGKPIISAFRAPIDNDRHVKVFWANLNVWQGENLDCAFNKVYNCYVEDKRIIVEGSLEGVSRKPFMKYLLYVDVFASGKMNISLKGTIRELL